MYLSNTAKGLMLDAIDESISAGAKFGSLHTAFSTTGTNEVTGGSPAYARKGLTWNAASAGSKALAATLPTFDVPASTTVVWLGFWDALTTGTFLGMVPLGAGTLIKCFCESGDVTANTIGAKAHGYTAGQAVVFYGSALPAGLTQGAVYYVIAAGLATDAFSVATTAGGSAVDITATGGGSVQSCTPEVFAGQGTYAVSSGSVDLGAVV